MRDLRTLARFRDEQSYDLHALWGSDYDRRIAGLFWIPSPTDGAPLKVIATIGLGWDHVSVSRKNRCPNWPEMSRVKDTFFLETETAMQLHVPASDHVNYHPHCLHLWRPLDCEIPRPDPLLVGPK